METNEIRKYLHDLSNALNTAKINAFLLRRIHKDDLDRETMDSLDASLQEAEKLVFAFQAKVHGEIPSNALPTA